MRAPRLALAAPSLAWVIGREAPDVVLSTASTGNIVAAMAHAAARSRARLVLSERTPISRDDGGGAAQRARRRAFAWAKQQTYHRADLVLAVARGIAAQLVDEIGVPAEKVRVVDNPMLDRELPALAAAELPPPMRALFDGGAPVVVACGRLVAVKDYPTLLEAFAKLRAQVPARLCVLGDGELRAELEQRARALGLGGDAVFAGFDKNPLRYFSRAALLLHASRAEGMPGAQIQAMACGAPVVSTDCDFGPREVLRDGVNGWLAPVGDAAALAERALRLLHDAPLRAAMSAAAKRSVVRFGVGPAMAQLCAALEGAPEPGGLDGVIDAEPEAAIDAELVGEEPAR